LPFGQILGSPTRDTSATATAAVNLTPTASWANPTPNMVPDGNFTTGPPNLSKCTAPGFCEGGPKNSDDGSNTGTAIGPWTITSGNVDWSVDGALYVNYVEPPYDSGAAVIDMDGNQPRAISQSIPTTTGVKYLLAFEYSGNNGYSAPLFTMNVNIGSYPVMTFNHVNTPTSTMTWEYIGIPFTAQSSSTTIAFTSTTPAILPTPYNYTGPTLANVVMQPATYSLVQ
jgi:hypothetical protein